MVVRFVNPCARVRPRVPSFVLCVSRLPRGVFLPVDSGNEDDARERAFALAFLDVDVGVLAPVLLL